jgi:regulatory protein YycI of two-component signal transduction system YycFG
MCLFIYIYINLYKKNKFHVYIFKMMSEDAADLFYATVSDAMYSHDLDETSIIVVQTIINGLRKKDLKPCIKSPKCDVKNLRSEGSRRAMCTPCFKRNQSGIEHALRTEDKDNFNGCRHYYNSVYKGELYQHESNDEDYRRLNVPGYKWSRDFY